MTQPWLRAPDLDFARVRDELGLAADFPAEALVEAGRAADRHAGTRIDRRDLELVTIDPASSMDLDQALRVRRDDEGFLVHYAIADVAALVTPGGALDDETRRRGSTVYFPDGSVPLHPRVLSENAGSLLPQQDRAAVLWTVRVDTAGDVLETTVERATVRSRARFDYARVAADAAAGALHPAITGLPAFGAAREEWSLDRGAVMLELPDQEVVRNDDPRKARAWTLRLAPSTPADRWNAQVSLLVGMCAGTIMRQHGTGFFRTLPAASDEAVGSLRETAARLRVLWPDGLSPGRFLAGLDPAAPSTLALMSAGASLMRGAGYRAILPGEDPVGSPAGAGPSDADLVHAGVGGLYAHVTAPLRRLADRYATEVCLAATAGEPVADWVVEALPGLGKIMSGANSIVSSAARRSVDLAEATVLSDQLGARFAATVMRAANERKAAEIFIAEPAVIAPCEAAPPSGHECTAEVTVADPQAGSVGFTAVAEGAAD